MLCVLFLGARMRALQMDPKHGNPQRWAQNCFFLCTSFGCFFFSTSIAENSRSLLESRFAGRSHLYRWAGAIEGYERTVDSLKIR